MAMKLIKIRPDLYEELTQISEAKGCTLGDAIRFYQRVPQPAANPSTVSSANSSNFTPSIPARAESSRQTIATLYS